MVDAHGVPFVAQCRASYVTQRLEGCTDFSATYTHTYTLTGIPTLYISMTLFILAISLVDRIKCLLLNGPWAEMFKYAVVGVESNTLDVSSIP